MSFVRTQTTAGAVKIKQANLNTCNNIEREKIYARSNLATWFIPIFFKAIFRKKIGIIFLLKKIKI